MTVFFNDLFPLVYFVQIQNPYDARRRRGDRMAHERDRHAPTASRHERARARPRNSQVANAVNCKSPSGNTPVRADRSSTVHAFALDDALEADANANLPAVDKKRSVANGGAHYVAAGGRVHFGEPSSQNAAFHARQTAIPQQLPAEEEFIAVRSVPNHVIVDPSSTSASAGADADATGHADCTSCAEGSCSECGHSASVASVDSLKQETCV